MPDQAPFSWIDSPGWIVLSGPSDPLSDIRAQALSRFNAGGVVAYISLADDLGDALMDDMAELGAPTGYLVDLEEQDNNETYDRLIHAGIIVVDAAEQADRLLRLMRQTAVHALKDALSHGALILFEGAAASLAGERFLAANGEVRSGLKFLSNVLVVPNQSSIASYTDSHKARLTLPETVFIGLPRGAALVLGPDGQIETWGDGDVTISLGDLAKTYALQSK